MGVSEGLKWQSLAKKSRLFETNRKIGFRALQRCLLVTEATRTIFLQMQSQRSRLRQGVKSSFLLKSSKYLGAPQIGRMQRPAALVGKGCGCKTFKDKPLKRNISKSLSTSLLYSLSLSVSLSLSLSLFLFLCLFPIYVTI